MDRAHVDDAAAARLVHMRQAGAGGEEGTVEMDRQHPAPVRQAEILQRVDDLDPGIADQDVHPAPGLDHRRDAVVDLGLVGHIHLHRHGRGTGPAQRLHAGAGRRQGQIGDGDLGALAGKGGGDLLADAAGSTRDDGDLVLELHANPLSIDFPQYTWVPAAGSPSAIVAACPGRRGC